MMREALADETFQPEEVGATDDPARFPVQRVRGLVQKDFRKVCSNGFGDPYNAYPHSMAWFRNRLYVGTTRACLAYRGRWMAETEPEGLGEIWPVRIPEGLFDIDLRGEIWCYDPETDHWSRVYRSPMIIGRDGFEVPLSFGFRTMVVFQGRDDPEPALYAPTWGTHQTPQAVMLRSQDGKTFQVVSEPGLGFPDPFKPRAVRGLMPFKGRLFSAPAVGQKRRQPNTSGIAVVLCTDNPAGGRWEVAGEPYFGNSNNLTVFHMAAFNDHLYVGTLNIHQGFEIWKTRAEGKPPFRWKRVMAQGAFRGKENQIAMTLVPFKGCLYVGSAVQTGGYDRESHVGPTAVELIRIHPDDSWELVVGDARLTPDGLKIPISGLGAGFDNPFSGYLWCMCEHEGWLYAGTFDWTTSLRYVAFGERVPDWLKRVLRNMDVEKLVKIRGGFKLWRTPDGVRWRPVSLNGFGNPYNYGVRTMMSTPYGLFVGAANPYGPEVAVKRTAGWRYEGNPRGGLEVWLGARDRDSSQGVAPFRSEHASHIAPVLVHRRDVPDRELQGFDRFVQELYRGSGYHHFGFWTHDTADPADACRNLMEELLAFVECKDARIVDLWCGSGATTAYLTQALPSAQVVGVASHWKQARSNRRVWKGVCFRSAFPYLKRAMGKSHDVAIFVNGLHFAGERRRLYRTAFQALKSGGQFVCFDFFAATDVSNRRGWWWRRQDRIRSIEDYKRLVNSSGFRDLECHEVTEPTFERFREYVGRTLAMEQLGRRMQPTLASILSKILLLDSPRLRCLICSAWKDK